MTALTYLRPLVAVLAAATLALGVPPEAPAKTLDHAGKPITNAAGATFGIQAHRGGMAEWPQNSLTAFTHSVAAGFDAIETDIRFTSDGRAVMSHDDVLQSRCTSTGRAIHSMTYAQVSKVRCANLAGAKVVPIATFEQLAGALAADTDVHLTLDIKTFKGQSTAGKRAWAAKALQLVIDHGLLSRTSILTFHWAAVTSTIRALAPNIYVLGLGNQATLNLDDVRLAARLGVSGFGLRTKNMSAYLASYIESVGMDAVPWEFADGEQLSFAIAHGKAHQLISADRPSKAQADLIAGNFHISPVATPRTTTLRTAATVSRATYTAGTRHYPKVSTKVLPASAYPMLRDVTLKITVSGSSGSGWLSVGACASPLDSSKVVALPKGGGTLTVTAPLGNGRKLRVFTTSRATLTVKVVAYTRIRFTPAW